jgi:hypothetical protein
VFGEIRGGGPVWDVESGGTVRVLVSDCQRPQSRARLKPETIRVTFEEFSPTHGFFDYRGFGAAWLAGESGEQAAPRAKVLLRSFCRHDSWCVPEFCGHRPYPRVFFIGGGQRDCRCPVDVPVDAGVPRTSDCRQVRSATISARDGVDRNRRHADRLAWRFLITALHSRWR